MPWTASAPAPACSVPEYDDSPTYSGLHFFPMSLLYFIFTLFHLLLFNTHSANFFAISALRRSSLTTLVLQLLFNHALLHFTTYTVSFNDFDDHTRLTISRSRGLLYEYFHDTRVPSGCAHYDSDFSMGFGGMVEESI